MQMHPKSPSAGQARPQHRIVLALGPLLLMGLVAMASCRKAPEARPTVQSLARAQTPMAVWAPKLGQAAQHTDAYLKALTRRAGSQALGRVHASVVAQLGFDPIDEASLQTAGLEPQSGIMLWRESPEASPLVALPCRDPKKLDATLKAIIEKRGGGAIVSRTRWQGLDIITVGRPFGQTTAPSAHWLYTDGFAVLTQGEGLGALQAFAQRRQALGRQPKAHPVDSLGGPDVLELPQGLAYVAIEGPHKAPSAQAPLGSNALPRPEVPTHRLTASWRWDEQGLAADMRLRDGLLTHDNLHSMFGGAPVGPLAGVVGEDAWALWLTRAASGERLHHRLQTTLARLGQLGLTPPAEALVLAVEEAIGPSLKGPVALGLHPKAGVTAAQLIGQLTRPKGLIQATQLAAVAEVSDPNKAFSGLKALPPIFASHQLKVVASAQSVAGRQAQVYTLEGLGLVVQWALWDGRLVAALGEGRLMQALMMLAQGPTQLAAPQEDSVLRQWHHTPGDVFVLRAATLGHFLELLAHAPDAAGQMGQAAGLAALMSSLSDVLHTLGDVAIGVADDSTSGDDAQAPLGAPMRLRLRQVMQ